LAGPFLFGLADLAIYAAVMSEVGEVPLAVTTDATIHFLRLPRVEPLIVRARVLKPGKRLVIAESTIDHESEMNAPVAHAVMTYSVPPAR
jgi:acyl-coenzyme A thioesterase PaaI-like protein